MRLLDTALLDLRFAFRSFKRAPIFTAVVLVTLIAGTAAVTTIFSYLNAVYFAPLPYANADRVVGVGQRYGNFGPASSASAVRLIRESSTSFDRVSVYEPNFPTVLFGTEPRQIQTLAVDTSFIRMFALRPSAGRLLTGEEIIGDAPVAMISHALWSAHFGADAAAIGGPLLMSNRSYQIVGVLPVGFRFPYRTDAITPLSEAALRDDPSTDADYVILGMLRQNVSRDDVRNEMRVLSRRIPPDPMRRARADLIVQDEMLDRHERRFLPLPGLFLGAGLFVLLIACANVANLFLARGAERQGEIAIRSSLGASRGRLVRQALTETLLLSSIAALAGAALSSALVRLGLHFVPTQGFPSWFRVTTDVRVLAFAIGVMLLVTIAAGLSPALIGTRMDLVRALKGGGGGGGDASGVTRRVVRSSARGLAVQLALAVALFVCAALLVRSYQRLTKVDVGYPAARIAVVQPLFDQARYPDRERRLPFLENVARELEGAPGVTKVAVRGRSFELRSAAGSEDDTQPRRYDPRLIPDRDSTRAVRSTRHEQYAVTDGYFALLDLRIREGRGFVASDAVGAEPVAVISAAAARLLWPGASALGRTIQVGAAGDALTVVGVVDDVYDLAGGRDGFRNPAMPAIYYSSRQAVSASPELLATGPGDVMTVRSLLVSRVRSADPSLVLLRKETLASQFDEALMVTRVFGGLIGAFALVALGLSVIGIYGVVAFGVARRTREIGIRMALGGTSGDVVRHVLGGTVGFVLIGLALGLVVAYWLARVLKVFLFGISPLDPAAYAGVCLLFGCVALLACYLPARRAARVDPLVALRAE